MESDSIYIKIIRNRHTEEKSQKRDVIPLVFHPYKSARSPIKHDFVNTEERLPNSVFIRYSGVHDEPRIRVTWSIVLVMSHLQESELAFTHNTYHKMKKATIVSTWILY